MELLCVDSQPRAPRSRLRQPSLRVGQRQRILERVHDPAVNAVCWRRRAQPVIPSHLLTPGTSVERVLRLDAMGHADVGALLTAVPDAPAWLGPDLERLIGCFGRLTGSRAFAACLAVVDTDSCRRLHADYVRLRLLCTYAGPGTLLLDEAHAVRSALAAEGTDWDAINAGIAPDPSQIHHAAAGDVVLLKGESWPHNLGRGALHRSPPLEGSGQLRLVFKLTLV